MKIGFSSGDFYRIFPKKEHVALVENIDWSMGQINAVELNCSTKRAINYFLSEDIDLSFLDYISVHGPNLYNLSRKRLKDTLLKLEDVNKKYGVDNFVFHINKGIDWQLIKNSLTTTVSIENMDDRKARGKTVESVKRLAHKHGLKVALDLQHCYTNDRSMNLAKEFHKALEEDIVEYHLSGYDSKLLHYPLFKTKQKNIIEEVGKDIPIIIESTFDKESEAKKELDYINRFLK